jgi:hypothetical protein
MYVKLGPDDYEKYLEFCGSLRKFSLMISEKWFQPR